jgi:integrase
LFRALQSTEDEQYIRRPAVDSIRLIALNGARRSEVTGLCWRHVDLLTGLLTVRPSAPKNQLSTRAERAPKIALFLGGAFPLGGQK